MEKQKKNGNFAPGTKLPFIRYQNGKQENAVYTVESFMASGGQADIYLVRDEMGQKWCLKHLYGHFAKDQADKRKFYNKLMVMARFPSPHPGLVWPVAVSPKQTKSGAFCYIMPYLDGYDETSRIISWLKRGNGAPPSAAPDPNSSAYRPVRNSKDPNDPAALSCAQRADIIRKGAEILEATHKDGYLYGDVSGKNILYKVLPTGGVDVKMIDVDNLLPAGDGTKTYFLGLQGTAEYRAPAVILGAYPTQHNDRHSIAVWSFRMLAGSNPLDGAMTHNVEWNEESVQKYFGKEPTFSITTEKNAASPAVFRHWDCLPELVKLYFKLAFSEQALHSPEPAPGQNDIRPSAQILAQCMAKGYNLK